MPTMHVSLRDRSYDVLVEPGALGRLGEITQSVAPHGRALLVVDSKILETHFAVAQSSLERAGFGLTVASIDANEHDKSLQTVHRLYDSMLAHRMERNSPVIALGGGVVGDVAGFAAATYLRGVPLIQAPTTLLAMVDAAIGGKTGVNIELPVAGTLGKNLIGAFWQPRAVVADPETLRTLNKRDLICGLAECLKHAMISDADLLHQIRSSFSAIDACEHTALTDLISRSASIKIDIVSRDEREAGERALLNLGHTFAHAIEPIDSLDLRHGEAVAIGLVAACHVSERTGRMSKEERVVVIDAIAGCGLPTNLTRPVPIEVLLDAMRYDKKVTDDQMRLILPCGIGTCQIVDEVDQKFVIDAWRAIGATG